jgi:hypothetical protein
MSRDDAGGGAGRGRAAGLTAALGVGLLVVWVAWVVESVRRDRLVCGRSTWVTALPFLAGDFRVSIDHVARLYARGADPYHMADTDWICAVYPYPPVVTRAFAWVSLLDAPVSAWVWLAGLAVILAGGAVGSWATRRELGLTPIPLPVVAAAVAFCTATVMAVERGQCDPLAIPAMGAAAWLLRRGTPGRDLAAGGILGLTAWLKYYPGLAALALLPLGRRRAFAAFVAVAGLIGVVDRAEVALSMRAGRAAAGQVIHSGPTFSPTGHSVAECWPKLWCRTGRPWRYFAKVPGPVVAAALLLPAAALVSRRVGRATDPGPLVWPLFLWLTALATFGLPVSNDYNLVPLPLAALAVWDRRDRPVVHAATALLLPWWQPFALPIDGRVLFLTKLAGLYAVGASLAARGCGNPPQLAAQDPTA